MIATLTAHAYTGERDLQRMQAALAHWIKRIGESTYWHVGDVPHRIYDNIRGLFPLDEVVRLWENAGEVIGFAVAQPETDRFDAFLHPEYRGSGLEFEIVEWAYQATRVGMATFNRGTHPVKANLFAGDTTRQNCLLQMGFEQDATYLCITSRSLLYRIDTPKVADGYTIRPTKGMSEAIALEQLHRDIWEWSPQSSYRDEVMLKPCYDYQHELLAVAPDGTLAAHTIYWCDTLNKIGYFEPVGTHPNHQRRGLARALMNHAMLLMREQGLESVRVCFNFQNEAAKSLYESLEFWQIGSITRYLKHAN